MDDSGGAAGTAATRHPLAGLAGAGTRAAGVELAGGPQARRKCARTGRNVWQSPFPALRNGRFAGQSPSRVATEQADASRPGPIVQGGRALDDGCRCARGSATGCLAKGKASEGGAWERQAGDRQAQQLEWASDNEGPPSPEPVLRATMGLVVEAGQ